MRLYLSSFRIGNHPKKLLELLHGGKRVAVIANAVDARDPATRAERLGVEFEELGWLGLDVTEIDLRNYFDGSFSTADLDGYDLVWVRGGNVFNLYRAMCRSGFDKVILSMLQQDAIVYGGYSAGACVLAPTFEGYAIVDDPHDVPDGYDATVPWQGLGLLDYAIEPHYKSDHSESADVDLEIALMTERNIPFKTLRDGEVIIIDGDEAYELRI